MRRILAFQTLWNVAGFVLPAMAAFAATPYLVHRLGTESFGYLSIVWVIFGVFGMLDLGIGRSLTVHIAKLSAQRHYLDARRFIETALTLILCLGFGLSAFSCLMLWVDQSKVEWRYLSSNVENFPAIFLIAATTWTVLHGAVMRGALEGFGDFKNSNLVKIFLGVTIFVLPSLVAFYTLHLFWIFASIVLARVLANWLAIACLRKHIGFQHFGFNGDIAILLFQTGGWITVSNILGPLIVYADRFVISAVLTVSALTYFSVPADAISRILILPSSIAIASFPFLAANSSSKSQVLRMIRLSALSSFWLLLPVALALFFLGNILMEYWMGVAFAKDSFMVVNLLSVAFCINGLAQVPFSAMQALGFAKVSAMWHLLQLVPYLLLLYFLTREFGISGSATAVLARCVFDTVGIWIMLGYKLKSMKSTAP
jgi:O-antigen/teichoic acid export membrane protein